jgi:hypothetical protein
MNAFICNIGAICAEVLKQRRVTIAVSFSAKTTSAPLTRGGKDFADRHSIAKVTVVLHFHATTVLYGPNQTHAG